MRRLADKPGGGGADIRADLGHNRRAAHLQQAMPGGIEFIADQRNRIQPGEIRQRYLAGADDFDQRGAIIDQAIHQ